MYRLISYSLWVDLAVGDFDSPDNFAKESNGELNEGQQLALQAVTLAVYRTVGHLNQDRASFEAQIPHNVGIPTHRQNSAVMRTL